MSTCECVCMYVCIGYATSYQERTAEYKDQPFSDFTLRYPMVMLYVLPHLHLVFL